MAASGEEIEQKTDCDNSIEQPSIVDGTCTTDVESIEQTISTPGIIKTAEENQVLASRDTDINKVLNGALETIERMPGEVAPIYQSTNQHDESSDADPDHLSKSICESEGQASNDDNDVSVSADEQNNESVEQEEEEEENYEDDSESSRSGSRSGTEIDDGTEEGEDAVESETGENEEVEYFSGEDGEEKTSAEKNAAVPRKPWINEKRHSGDGQEQPERTDKSRDAEDQTPAVPPRPVDDDEDRKNPAYIPRKGYFFEHDQRNDDDDAVADDSAKKKESEKKSKRLWKEDTKWHHDKYDEAAMAPKSREEIIAYYGTDIREYDDINNVPQGRPRRGRGGGRGRGGRGRGQRFGDYFSQELLQQKGGQSGRNLGDSHSDDNHDNNDLEPERSQAVRRSHNVRNSGDSQYSQDDNRQASRGIDKMQSKRSSGERNGDVTNNGDQRERERNRDEKRLLRRNEQSQNDNNHTILTNRERPQKVIISTRNDRRETGMDRNAEEMTSDQFNNQRRPQDQRQIDTERLRNEAEYADDRRTVPEGQGRRGPQRSWQADRRQDISGRGAEERWDEGPSAGYRRDGNKGGTGRGEAGAVQGAASGQGRREGYGSENDEDRRRRGQPPRLSRRHDNNQDTNRSRYQDDHDGEYYDSGNDHTQLYQHTTRTIQNSSFPRHNMGRESHQQTNQRPADDRYVPDRTMVITTTGRRSQDARYTDEDLATGVQLITVNSPADRGRAPLEINTRSAGNEKRSTIILHNSMDASSSDIVPPVTSVQTYSRSTKLRNASTNDSQASNDQRLLNEVRSSDSQRQLIINEPSRGWAGGEFTPAWQRKITEENAAMEQDSHSSLQASAGRGSKRYSSQRTRGGEGGVGGGGIHEMSSTVSSASEGRDIMSPQQQQTNERQQPPSSTYYDSPPQRIATAFPPPPMIPLGMTPTMSFRIPMQPRPSGIGTSGAGPPPPSGTIRMYGQPLSNPPPQPHQVMHGHYVLTAPPGGPYMNTAQHHQLINYGHAPPPGHHYQMTTLQMPVARNSPMPDLPLSMPMEMHGTGVPVFYSSDDGGNMARVRTDMMVGQGGALYYGQPPGIPSGAVNSGGGQVLLPPPRSRSPPRRPKAAIPIVNPQDIPSSESNEQQQSPQTYYVGYTQEYEDPPTTTYTYVENSATDARDDGEQRDNNKDYNK